MVYNPPYIAETVARIIASHKGYKAEGPAQFLSDEFSNLAALDRMINAGRNRKDTDFRPSDEDLADFWNGKGR